MDIDNTLAFIQEHRRKRLVEGFDRLLEASAQALDAGKFDKAKELAGEIVQRFDDEDIDTSTGCLAMFIALMASERALKRS